MPELTRQEYLRKRWIEACHEYNRAMQDAKHWQECRDRRKEALDMENAAIRRRQQEACKIKKGNKC